MASFVGDERSRSTDDDVTNEAYIVRLFIGKIVDSHHGAFAMIHNEYGAFIVNSTMSTLKNTCHSFVIIFPRHLILWHKYPLKNKIQSI